MSVSDVGYDERVRYHLEVDPELSLPNNALRYIFPIGTTFWLRNESQIEKVLLINSEYEGIDRTDELTQEAADRLAPFFLSPL